MPGLLLDELAQALRRYSGANGVYRQSGSRIKSARRQFLTLVDKLAMMEQYIGKKVIDAVVVWAGKLTSVAVNDRVVIQDVLEASDIPYRHDRQLLHNALEKALQALG
ncbi:protein YbhK [Salmonella bongori]|nr:protein YbhK [Salmonella bongori]